MLGIGWWLDAVGRNVGGSGSGAFKSRRSIIPTSGFYERTGAAGAKQPHLFNAADGAPILAFAGLWERWRSPETQDDVLSCTIVVSGASAWMEPYHDRMPILLQADQVDRWLNGTMGAVELQPAAESALREWTVTPSYEPHGLW